MLLAVAIAASACAPAARPPAAQPAALPAAPAAQPSGPPNVEVSVGEVIQRAELDGLSYAKVFVGGELAGQTDAAPRSRQKLWRGRVEPGNHPVRLELWVLPGLGAWERLPDEQQPRERFVRVEAGSMTRVEVLRRGEEGSYDFRVTRQPL